MPRIELIPPQWEASKEKARGEGTPTIDVCKRCALDFNEAELVSDTIEGYPLHSVGSVDVYHPSYGDIDMEGFKCASCGKELLERDD